jgi:acyl carrier protein
VVGANPNPPDGWGSDSLDRIEIVMACEEVLGEEISDEEMQIVFRYFRTKEELLDYLRRRKKGGHLN